MTDFDFGVIHIALKKTCLKSPNLRWGNFVHILVLFLTLWKSTVAGIQNKLLTGTIIAIHLEKEAFVVKNT